METATRSVASAWLTSRSDGRGLTHAVRGATLAAALCAWLAAPVSAGEWSASAGWGLRLDDHRVGSVTPGEPGARFAPWTQAITPAMAFTLRPLGAQLEVDASGRVEVGAPVPGEGLGSLRRGTSAEAHAALARTFANGLSFVARGEAERSRDLLDVDHATVSSTADAARWGASTTAASRAFAGEWRERGWRSGTATAADTRTLAWGARVFLIRPAPGAVYVGARERRMERDGGSLLRARVAALGARRDLAPGLSATLEVGALGERIGPEREAPRATAALELASPRDAAGATRLRLWIARELGTEFAAELEQRVGRARAWARASSEVDIEGSGATAPAVIQRAALGAGDTLVAATVLGIEASVARNRSYRGLPLERVESARLRAWLERRLQPWLTCRAAWDVLERNGNDPGAAPAFRRSRFEIQIRANAR
jgi:hypothetical protein